MLDWIKKGEGHPDHPTRNPAAAAKLLAEMRGADPLTALTDLSAWLEAAKGTPSVQMVSAGADGTIDFPASVDFGPTHVIVPGATGIRRRRRRLGAVGEDG